MTAEALAVRAPADRNPVAAAVVKTRVTRLARPTGRKVLLVGWDGADWLMIRPLIAAGRLPNLAALIRRGASGELVEEVAAAGAEDLGWIAAVQGGFEPGRQHGVEAVDERPPASGLDPVALPAGGHR